MRCIFFGACLFLLLSCFWLSVSSPVNCGGSSSTQMMTTTLEVPDETLTLDLETLSDDAEVLQQTTSPESKCHNSYVCKYHCPCKTIYLYLDSKNHDIMAVNKAVCLGDSSKADKTSRAVLMKAVLQNTPQFNITSMIRNAVTLALYENVVTRAAISDWELESPTTNQTVNIFKTLWSGVKAIVESSPKSSTVSSNVLEVEEEDVVLGWPFSLFGDLVHSVETDLHGADRVAHDVANDATKLFHGADQVAHNVANDATKLFHGADQVARNVANDARKFVHTGVTDFVDFADKNIQLVARDIKGGLNGVDALRQVFGFDVDNIASAVHAEIETITSIIKANLNKVKHNLESDVDNVLNKINTQVNQTDWTIQHALNAEVSVIESLAIAGVKFLQSRMSLLVEKPEFIAACESKIKEQYIMAFVQWYQHHIEDFYVNFQNLCTREYGNVDNAIRQMESQMQQEELPQVSILVNEVLKGFPTIFHLKNYPIISGIVNTYVSKNLYPLRLAVLNVFLRIYNDKVLTCSCQDMINYAQEKKYEQQQIDDFQCSIASVCHSQC